MSLQDQKSDLPPFLDLQMARYCFTLAFSGKEQLPAYPALGMRGLLGRALQKLVCPFPGNPENKCKQCLINAHCPYYCLYEQQTNIGGRIEAPKGYIVYTTPFPKGQELNLELTLFGCCTTFFSVLLSALNKSGEIGLGLEDTRKKTFQVIAVYRQTPDGKELLMSNQTAIDQPEAFLLKQWLGQREQVGSIACLKTPLRLTKQREKSLNWSLLYTNLARRLEGLNMVYGNGESFGKEKWQEIVKDFSGWPIPQAKLHWTELERYSGRQRQTIPLGGFIGEVDLQGVSTQQRAWWQVASLIHVGRSAVMGLGRIEII
jgi:hypothetical protein